MNKWIINTPDIKAVDDIVKNSDLSKLAAQVLVSRGYDSISKAAELFEGAELSSPFLLRDMTEAVEHINSAIDSGKVICIYGDYDCDGITSTVMLYSYLSCMGADVFYYIPEREEGYGLNVRAVKELAGKGTELIITVDNGISAIKEAELISELGMELIVTDHHRPSDVLPKALAIVDPYRADCTSPFKNLCGAGVVLKLIAALSDGSYETALEQFSDLAAIGTIADVVKLTGENRTIVRAGLRYLANTENLGLSSLLEETKLNESDLTSTQIAFRLSPKINAPGRCDSTKTTVELFLSEDEDEAAELASELLAFNTKRKSNEDVILKDIDRFIGEHPEILNDRVLVFSGENWHHGVIGIVSTRITERYGKPSFIISVENGEGRGSARSVNGFSIFEALTYCNDLLIKFGGHTGAGGFSLTEDKIALFREKIALYAKENFPTMPKVTLTADKVLENDDFTVEAINGLSVLEPFGEGNSRPIFAVLGATITDITPFSEGKNSRVSISYQDIQTKIAFFGLTIDSLPFSKGDKWDFLVHLEINNYMNSSKPEMRVLDYRKSGIVQAKYFNAKDAYERYMLGEGIPDVLKSRVIPTREELVKIYTSISQIGKTTDMLFCDVADSDINYFKLRVALDAFSELSLIHIDYGNNKVFLVPTKKKVNLEDSQTLRKIKAL